MIVADRKPFDEIMGMIEPCGRILLVGCNECVTVCAVGGAKEVALLASQIRMKRKVEARPIEVDEKTLERQCDPEYVNALAETLEGYDAVLSLACGCGVQLVAETCSVYGYCPASTHDSWGSPRSTGYGRTMPGMRRLRSRQDMRHMPRHEVREKHHERPLRGIAKR
jgi:hypothetical protein